MSSMPERLIQSYMDIIIWLSLSFIIVLTINVTVNVTENALIKSEVFVVYSQINDAGYIAKQLHANITILIKSLHDISIYLNDDLIVIYINSNTFTFRSDVIFQRSLIRTNKQYMFTLMNNYVVVEEIT